MIHDAHAFRGEYIDLCAQIERWAVEILDSAPARRTGKAAKVPHLLGQKLKLIAELATDGTVFARSERIQALLSELEPFIRLRSDLAHATVAVTTNGDIEVYAFERPIATAFAGGERFWLKRDETPALIAALKKSRKELRDQKLKD